MTDGFISYPRTQHLEGSRLQPGDRDDGVRLKDLPKGMKVWEEKLDGANSGVSFIEGHMMLQSRGHYLTGGARERQFAWMKSWTAEHEVELYEVLGDRFVCYFENLLAVHSIAYDSLPCFLMEEDIFDRERGVFLDTQSRRRLTHGSCIHSVPVLHEGELKTQAEIKSFIRRPLYQTPNWRENFARAAEAAGEDPERALARIDRMGEAEGLYLKVEDTAEGKVVGRFKWVRPTFLQTILESGTHWSQRPMIRNRLASEMSPQERDEEVARLRAEARSAGRKADRRYTSAEDRCRRDDDVKAFGEGYEVAGRFADISIQTYDRARELKASENPALPDNVTRLTSIGTNRAREDLFDFLERVGEVSTSAIAARFGWDHKTAYNVLSNLRKGGYIDGANERLGWAAVGGSGHINVWRLKRRPELDLEPDAPRPGP